MSLSTVTGRILNVTTRQLGTSLTKAANAGDTTLYVDDCSAFEDDGTGGWVSINDQVIQFDTVDDDASTIHLLTGLTAAADEGDPVYSWSTLYQQIDDEQTALVQVDGDTDLADPVHADIGEGVGTLPDGLRGDAGETCTLTHLSPGVWEITAVGGRPSAAKGIIKFEADDLHVISATDVTMGTATISLSHRPIDESLVAFWRATPQEPTEYTVDGDAQTVTWPLSGFEQAGDRLWVHYAYTASLAQRSVGWQATGWRYLVVTETDTVDRSAVSFDDSSWASGQGGFGNVVAVDGTKFHTSLGWPPPTTVFDPPPNLGLWIRRPMSEAPAGVPLTLRVRVDGDSTVFWNGIQLATRSASSADVDPIDVPASARGGTDLLAIHIVDDVPDPSFDFLYLDARIEW